MDKFTCPAITAALMITCMYSLMLLNVRELFECLVAESTRVLADVGVNERMLSQLLSRRERLHTLQTPMSLRIQTMCLLCVSLHVRLGLKILQYKQTALCYLHVERRRIGKNSW